MKKIILLSLLCLCCVSSVLGQNWNKETQKYFRSIVEVDFQVDLSNALILGVSIDKFPIYYAGKYHASEEFGEVVLDKFKNEMRNEFFTHSPSDKRFKSDSPVKVVYHISNVTEKGGISGYYYVNYSGNISTAISFEIEDGRWNTFEELLKENICKLMTSENPYKRKLYK